MPLHPLAGKTAPPSSIANIPALVASYYRDQPDIEAYPEQSVSFGTSGHRGSALLKTFNEDHIKAISQAIAEFRKQAGITGPLYLGKDTHALSEPAFLTCLEVLAGNGVQVRIQLGGGYTPTPVISHAILTHNEHAADLADGIVITPSHNPPEDGGIKYNMTHGGPADTQTTQWVADRANELLKAKLAGVKSTSIDLHLGHDCIEEFDYINHYVADLDQVINMKAIADAGIRIGVDPLGGSGLHYWKPIAER